MNSWSEYFSVVPDPRRQSGLTRHLLSEILGLALCVMLCGADDFVEMALFGRERLEFLRERLGFVLQNGVPSHDTLNRVFKRLDPSALEKCLLGWVDQWQQQQQRHLCIDGKVARGSWEHQTNVCALTTVSLYACEMRLMLCRGRLKGQGGENLLAVRLLELFDLQGAVVTGDAAYCQKDVARSLVQAQGDSLFVLKANHRRLYRQVQNAFQAKGTGTGTGHHEGHGRREERRVFCVGIDELELDGALVGPWPGLQTLVRVERTRQVTPGQKAGTQSRSVWFYLSSLAPDDAGLVHLIRSHWLIENQAHWVLDVVFGEDRCRTRRDHAPYNLALLRRISLNLLRQNQGKNSLKATRKAVTWNQNLLCKILHTPLALL